MSINKTVNGQKIDPSTLQIYELIMNHMDESQNHFVERKTFVERIKRVHTL